MSATGRGTFKRKAAQPKAGLEIARAAVRSAAELLAGPGEPEDFDLELALEDVERAARWLRALIDAREVVR
jgi:hypothetical protein